MDGAYANNLQPSILIVEDEAALVELLAYNLEKAGFRTAVARDGEEALLAIAENKPDLVLAHPPRPGNPRPAGDPADRARRGG